MINENIKKARKASGISQEEMAVKLNVVRQTVSKWENGLSVPDADVLIQIAEVLGVSVGQLLGVEDQNDARQDLAEKLAELNEELAVKSRKERLVEQANKKRSIIVFGSFVSLLITLAVKNATISVILVGSSILAMIVILYQNLALLTSITTEDMKIRTLRVTTIVNFEIIGAVIAITILDKTLLLEISKGNEKVFVTVSIMIIMLFAGFISPKLPFNRHTGLRLPWTVRDEDTWNVAHRTLGYISFPIALLYFAASWTISNYETVTLAAVILWLGIPGVLSLMFFRKKQYSNH